MSLLSLRTPIQAQPVPSFPRATRTYLHGQRRGRLHRDNHISRCLKEEADEEEVFSQSPVPLARTLAGLKKPPSDDGVAVFMYKVKLAWNIFFPVKPEQMTPTEEVKKRLRMVLVADRCGMSPASLADMRKTIVRALEDYVDIESEDLIEVVISNDPDVGVVYSVNIPVRKVKSDVRFADIMAEAADGVSLEWSPESYDADPSNRFPMGT